jgi:cobalt-zinc-cadmium efflux system outer membrane protein
MYRLFLPLTLLIAASAFAQIQSVPEDAQAPAPAATLPLAASPQESPGQSPGAPTAQGPAHPRVPSAANEITLDEAIRLALLNNPNLQATRKQIDENLAQETTANLRPNPELSGDSQFLPIFNPSQFSSEGLNTITQFDLGLGYLFERGRKRQNRLQAARDATAVTRSQVVDAERTLTFNVGQQFINALLAKSNLEFASQALSSFRQTVTISEERYRAGDISEGDLLKIKLQLLQFQTDVAQARVAKTQALINLRQLMGYQSVPHEYDVAGELEYVPLKGQLLDVQAKARQERPDFRAAQQGVTAAQSQVSLAKANGKQDLNLSVNYSHVSGESSTSWFFSIPLPIFDRNQGEIKRTLFAVDQSKFQATSTEETVMSDVGNAWESAASNEEIVKLYTSGYLKDAQDSREITNYAYKAGAVTLLDLLDSERSYRTTELAYRQALATYMISIEQLKEAVGTRSLP